MTQLIIILYGISVDNLAWSIDTAPTVMWITAIHEGGACQSSEPWPFTVVPSTPCQWVIKRQPRTVVAGQPFSVSVALFDGIGSLPGNVAYCDWQVNHWRFPATSKGGKVISQTIKASPKDCQAECKSNPRCTSWNYASKFIGFYDAEDFHRDIVSGTCIQYRGITFIPERGWVEIDGAISGQIGGIPCQDVYLSMEAQSATEGTSAGTLFEVDDPIGEVKCITLPSLEFTISMPFVDNREGCIRCCRDEGAQAIITFNDRCTCATGEDFDDATSCPGFDIFSSKPTAVYEELLDPHRKTMDSHKVTYSRLWYNKVENIKLSFYSSLDDSCGIATSSIIKVLPSFPHHLKTDFVPTVWEAPDCGGSNGPIRIILNIVDYWRNVVPTEHRISASIMQGTGDLGNAKVMSRNGIVEFELTYNRAENLVLFIRDLDISSAGFEGQVLESIDDETNVVQSKCEKRCYGDSCLVPTAPICCMVLPPIKIMTGPASRLKTISHPPEEIKSYGEGDCEPFDFTVELQDSCGNRITKQWSGEYAVPWKGHRLDVMVYTSEPERYENSDPSTKFETRSSTVLSDGRCTIIATHSRVDSGISLSVAVANAPNIAVAYTTSVEVDHCTPRKLDIISPQGCRSGPIPIIGTRQTMFPMNVAILDKDGNLCDTSDPLSYSKIGCFSTISLMEFEARVNLHKLSRNECMEACFEQFTANYFAIIAGSQCWCSIEEPKSLVIQSEEACTQSCPSGEANCGGSDAMILFELRSSYSIVEYETTKYPNVGDAPPRYAGQGGVLSGSLSAEAEEGIALLDNAVWLPDEADQISCYDDATGATCKGLTTLRVSDSFGNLEGDACTVEVQNDVVQCPNTEILRVRAGEHFDIWSFIKPPEVGESASIAMNVATVSLKLFDESGELSATGTFDSGKLAGEDYPDGYRPIPASPPTNHISRWYKEDGQFIFDVSPVAILAETGTVWFPNLMYSSKIPGIRQGDVRGNGFVERTIKIQSDFAEECLIKVQVYPGKVTKCSQTAPSRGCYRANMNFDFRYTALDFMDNVVVQDMPRCVSTVQGSQCPAGTTKFFPQHENWATALQPLFDPSAEVEQFGVGVTIRQEYGVQKLFASDTLQYIDSFRQGVSFPGAGMQQIASGDRCVVLSRRKTFQPDSDVGTIVSTWELVPCDSITRVLCTDTTDNPKACTGSSSTFISQTTASVALDPPSTSPVDVLNGRTRIQSKKGIMDFSLNTNLATQVGRNMIITVRDPTGSEVTCDKQNINLLISPNAPKTLTASIQGKQEISTGVVCLSCSPSDEFSVTTKAWDAWGNLCSWDCKREDKWATKVGKLKISVFTGDGQVVESADSDVKQLKLHEAVRFGYRLDQGIATFTSLRYTKPGIAIFQVDASNWDIQQLGPVPQAPRVSLKFEACNPRAIRVINYERNPVAGKSFIIDVEVVDQYSNVITSDHFGLLSALEKRLEFAFLDGYADPERKRSFIARNLNKYIDDPGRYSYFLNHESVMYQASETGVDRFGLSIQTLIKQPMLIEVSLPIEDDAYAVLGCTLEHREYEETLITNIRNNEPYRLGDLRHDDAVQYDEPFPYGVSAAQFDRFGNQAFEWRDYGVIQCQLEFSVGIIKVKVAEGDFQEKQYSVIEAPTADVRAAVSVEISWPAGDSSTVVDFFLGRLGLQRGEAFIESITLKEDPASIGTRRLHQFGQFSQGDIVIVKIVVVTPGATEKISTFIQQENTCEQEPSAENCCKGGFCSRCFEGVMSVCVAIKAAPKLLETSIPDELLAPNDAPLEEPTVLQSKGYGYEGKYGSSRSLLQTDEELLAAHFQRYPTSFALTNTVNYPKLGGFTFPVKEVYFVPTLLMGTTADISAPGGAVRFHESYVWFKDTFARRSMGRFKLMTTCIRLDNSKIGIDDPFAPPSFRMETDWIQVSANVIQIIESPTGKVIKSDGMCRRAGDQFSIKTRLVLPSGEPLNSQPVDVRLYSRVTSGTVNNGPFACDTTADTSHEVECTLNINDAVVAVPVDSDLIGKHLVGERLNAWTTIGSATVSIFHDIRAEAGYESATTEMTIPFIHACPQKLISRIAAPREVVVDTGFTLSYHLQDRFGNRGGDYGVKLRAYRRDPIEVLTSWDRAAEMESEAKTAAAWEELATYEIEENFFTSIVPLPMGRRTLGGEVGYPGLAIDPDFLRTKQMMDSVELTSTWSPNGLVWIMAYVPEGSGMGCDNEDRCSPFNINSDSCKSVMATTNRDTATEAMLIAVFGCLRVETIPIMVTPDVGDSCKFIDYPGYAGITAGPRFDFDLSAEIVDRHGLRIHEAPPLSFALVYISEGKSGIRQKSIDLNFFDEVLYTNVIERSIRFSQLTTFAMSSSTSQLPLHGGQSNDWLSVAAIFRLNGLPTSTIILFQATQNQDGAGPTIGRVELVVEELPTGTAYFVQVKVIGLPEIKQELHPSQLPTQWDEWILWIQRDSERRPITVELESVWNAGYLFSTSIDGGGPTPIIAFNRVFVGPIQVFSTEVFTSFFDTRFGIRYWSWYRHFFMMAEPVSADTPSLQTPGVLVFDDTLFDTTPDLSTATMHLSIPFGGMVVPIHLPAACNPAAPGSIRPASCLTNSLKLTVNWKNLWYGIGHDDIVISMRAYSAVEPFWGFTCSTPQGGIHSRPGPPFALRCADVLEEVFTRDAWHSSVDFVDVMGNKADCYSSFDDTDDDRAKFADLDVTCSENEVTVTVLGAEPPAAGLTQSLLQPHEKTTSEFNPRGRAEFSVYYAQKARAPLETGGAQDGATLGSTIEQFGINPGVVPPTKEGWDAAGFANADVLNGDSNSRGVWTVGAAASAPGGQYFSGASSVYNQVFMRYLTNGRNIPGSPCETSTLKICSPEQDENVNSCCRLNDPGRIIPLRSYSLQFKYRTLNAANTHTGQVEVHYWMQARGSAPRVLSSQRVMIPAESTGDNFISMAYTHTAADRATYATIKIQCDRSMDLTLSQCGVDFDEVALVLLEEEQNVTLKYTSNLQRQEVGKNVLSVSCGPTLVKTKSIPPAPRVAGCTPQTCNNNGYCSQTPWACPNELQEMYPPYCCRRALSYCCGGLMRDTADAEFRSKCGNAFCSGQNGQFPLPPPCSSCHASDTLGFWAGDNCEKCKTGYYGERCQFRICPINLNNGKECSGHGLCQSNGECTCFGSISATTQTSVPAVSINSGYLVVAADDTATPASERTIPYSSCHQVLGLYKSGQVFDTNTNVLGLPDEGIFKLGVNNADGSTGSSEYFCRFLRTRDGRFVGGAVVGGAWKLGTGTLASNMYNAEYKDATATGFMPLANFGSPQSRMFSPGVSAPLGRRWLFTGIQDGGGAGGGAFARQAPSTFDSIIFATNSRNPKTKTQWIQVKVSELQGAVDFMKTAVAAGNLGPLQRPISLVNSNTKIPLTEVCIYTSGRECATCQPRVNGIFSACGDENANPDFPNRHTAWTMWYGEGNTGRTQRTIANSIRILVSEITAGVAPVDGQVPDELAYAGYTFTEEQQKWEIDGAVEIPHQFTQRAPASFRTSILGVAEPPKRYHWSTWDGKPARLSLKFGSARIRSTFEEGAKFRGLPSTLAELQSVTILSYVTITTPAGAAPVNYKMTIITSEGRQILLWKNNPARLTTTFGVQNGFNVVSVELTRASLSGYGLLVSDLPGMCCYILSKINYK